MNEQDPDVAAIVKKLKEKALVLAFHFLFPGLGYVSQMGDTWQWKPISTID